MATPPSPVALPLAERKGDAVLALALVSLGTGGALFDSIVALDLPLGADAANPVARAAWWYGTTVDPLLLSEPLWLRICVTVSFYVFVPFYFVAAAAVVRGWGWIQLPAVIVSSMVCAFTAFPVFGVELFGGPGERSPESLLFLAINGPYLLVPLVLLARMRRPDPFARRF